MEIDGKLNQEVTEIEEAKEFAWKESKKNIRQRRDTETFLARNRVAFKENLEESEVERAFNIIWQPAEN